MGGLVVNREPRGVTDRQEIVENMWEWGEWGTRRCRWEVGRKDSQWSWGEVMHCCWACYYGQSMSLEHVDVEGSGGWRGRVCMEVSERGLLANVEYG